MSMQQWFCSLCLWSAALLCGRTHAAELQSLLQIQARVEQHLMTLLARHGGALHVTAGDLDPRLRLAACAMPLEVFIPNGANIGSRVTMGVRCAQPATAGNQWTLYVPVNIETELPALVLNKALPSGTLVTAQDFETRTQRVPGLTSQYLQAGTELRGKRLKRAVAAGTLLTPEMFEQEVLIRRGQQVIMLARVAGIEVRSQGVALSDGRASSRIQVKNLNSAKVVEGLVDSNSVVLVEL